MNSIIKFVLKVTEIVILSVRVSKSKSAVIISVRPYKRVSQLCPICGRKCEIYDTSKNYKLWRALDILCAKCYLEYKPHRVRCKKCGVHTESVPWARHNSMFTSAFEDWVAYLSVQCTKSAVSKLARIEWHTVGNIVKRVFDDLECKRDKSRFDSLKRIGIDETSYKKGHKYITVVVDHDTSSLVWASKGRSADTLDKFFRLLTKKQRDNIKVVSADGARWIKKVIKKRCKNAAICMDPFHTVSWMNDALDKVRREEWNVYKTISNKLKPSKRDSPGRPTKEDEKKREEYKIALEATNKIKNSRWPLLKGYDNLTDSQKNKLEELKNGAGKHLFRAWELKEDLRSVFRAKDIQIAEKLLEVWLKEAAYCKIKPVVKVEKEIRKRKEDVLAAIRLGVSNGRIEAINNKIKVTIKMGYGFRNVDNLVSLLMLKCSDIQPELPFIKDANDDIKHIRKVA